jgi:hypothetical protein
MFEDRCHERGVACPACASELSKHGSFAELEAELRDAGFDASYLTAVRGMWMLARARGGGKPSCRGVKKKKCVRPDDRLEKIAERYGVIPSPSTTRASLVRLCLKRSHPDKKRSDYTEQDREDYAYLVKQLKARP